MEKVTEQLHVLLSKTDVRRLSELARNEECSMGALVRRLIKQAYAKKKRNGGR